ncbi:HIT family protein [Candidatus Woesearchaeota archaeon]|nr:MAG: HIT family protein [Candidatus Woesearchaeota archaeon]
MTDCIFCKIVSRELPAEIIGEDENFICFLDIKPIAKGHALIVPKKHYKDILEFPTDMELDFFAFLQKMTKKIIAAVGAHGYNIGMNNGAAAGQVIFHQHTHIIPRFNDDGLVSWPSKELSPEEIAEIKQQILNVH